MIQSNAIYNRKELAELGIGREVLTEARKSGIVVPRKLGTTFFYSGTELIAWSERNQVRREVKCRRPETEAAAD